MLQRRGATIAVAGDGEQALAMLAERSFDLVFMDCHMPVLDGFQATRRLRDMERVSGKHIPVIAMTANALAGDRERCLEAGMDDYIAKPMSIAVLSAVLSRWTDRGGTRLEASQHSDEGDADTCLDPGVVADLRSLASPGTIAAIDGFISDLPSRTQAIAKAFADDDLETVHRLVHSLKGTSGCLGAVGMQEALGVVDRAAQAGDRSSAWTAWRRAQPIIIASSAAFRGLAASLRAGRDVR
jgi:CheY-like chemotaxis protein